MTTAIDPARHRRAKPGAKGGGRFFHVEVRPSRDFVTFRVQKFGGGIERVAGRRAGGTWATATWLIGKDHAHLANGRLVADSDAADRVLARLGAAPVHIGGDRFRIKPARKIARAPRKIAKAA